MWGNGLQYRPIAGFPVDMPYFCLRVTTGGAKTRLAVRAVELVNSKLLRTEHSAILRLALSHAIREQTYKTLTANPWISTLIGIDLGGVVSRI